MTERGILMTPANYGKCEDGTKTQTRRIVKPQPEKAGWNAPYSFFHHGEYWTLPNGKGIGNTAMRSPYGMPGDRLYVKEPFYAFGQWDKHEKRVTQRGRPRRQFITYGSRGCRYINNPPENICRDYDEVGWFRRSALFMPKRWARLWLDLTDLRVERIQEITLADVGKEGYAISVDEGSPSDFAKPWDKINGEGAWERNDWVWVLSFRRIKP